MLKKFSECLLLESNLLMVGKFILMLAKILYSGDALLHQLPRFGRAYAWHTCQKIDGNIGVICSDLDGKL